MPMRVVLTGDTMARHPTAGGHWSVRLQYLLGLQALNVDFLWLELYRPTGHPAKDAANVQTFLSRFRRWGIGRNIAVAIVDRDAPPRCLQLGCRSRDGCPVGRASRFPEEQVRFHLAAFLRPRV